MDLKTLSIIELKSIAYDQLAQIEQCQVNLKAINAELAEKNKPMSEEIVAEVVAEEVIVEAPVEETVAEEVAE